MSSQAMMVFPGLLRPILCVIPSTLLIPLWRESGMLPIGIPMIMISFLATAAIGWLVGLTNAERNHLMSVVPRLPLLS
jgi:hypothetical protein